MTREYFPFLDDRWTGEVPRRFAERWANLLPESYLHVIFTLPAKVADIALQNKAVISGLL